MEYQLFVTVVEFQFVVQSNSFSMKFQNMASFVIFYLKNLSAHM